MKETENTTSVYHINGTTGIYTVYGADTWIGAHMVQHLRNAGYNVYAIPQSADFSFDGPVISYTESVPTEFPPCAFLSDWVIIALDSDIGFMRYIVKIKKLTDYFLKTGYFGHICFFSSASVCAPNEEPLSETSSVYPDSEQELSLITAENLFHYMYSNKKYEACAHIMRAGELYGDEIGCFGQCGAINKLVDDSRKNLPLPERLQPWKDTYCSLTHISDFCRASIELMKLGALCPSVVNIPGENIAVNDILSRLPESETKAKRDSWFFGKEEFFGNHCLDDDEFNLSVKKLKREYSFAAWLKESRADKEHISIA